MTKNGELLQKIAKVSVNPKQQLIAFKDRGATCSRSKMPKMVILKKPKACGQTMLPDRSVLIVQKLVENANIEK